jgi:hypothetical protein
MKRCVRVTLKLNDDPHWDMTLTLILRSDGMLKEGMAFCGWWGLLGSSDLLPLIVLDDGRVDFGSDETTDQSDRCGIIKLHDRRIAEGEKISYTDSEVGERIFAIVEIDDLVG